MVKRRLHKRSIRRWFGKEPFIERIILSVMPRYMLAVQITTIT
jgi:hypothetical protein